MMNWKKSLDKFRSSKTYLLILGASATLWFLIRVIPKPSRARYPCMQAAAPIMSTFVIYLLGLYGGIAVPPGFHHCICMGFFP
jgi:hypothetical protein